MKKARYILFTLVISFIFISNTYAIDDYNTSFCTGTIQGVFTTIGWVFFFAKILIPIVLIIFGSIDFAKAVVSGKPDDEIKKSMTGLIKRCIAGVVIFFVPALLSLVVDVIGGDNIYDGSGGTFTDCTKCMLNPKGNCSSLGGN